MRPARAAPRILDAFAEGRGQGVLHLAAAELDTELPPALAYWRDLGRTFVARACAALDPGDPATPVVPEPEPADLAELVDAVPPMPGAELVTAELLGAIWADAGAALAAKAQGTAGGVQGYLSAQGSVWHVVGRVCFHLAENKRDPDYPFAFMATYVDRVSRQARAQHLPLGRALEAYAGARNRQKLLALLAPLSRAAESSELVRELVDGGDVYHPLSWTAGRGPPLPPRGRRPASAPAWWSACPTGGAAGGARGPR